MAQVVSLLIASLAFVVALLVEPGQARACGGLECIAGTFHPASGSVPANLKGIYWWPSFSWGQDDAGPGEGKLGVVRLARVDGPTPELIDVTLQPIARWVGGRDGFLVVPQTPFVAGASYVAWDPGCNELDDSTPPPYREPEPDFLYPFLIVEWSVARFTVAEAAPLPSELGELVVSAQRDADVWVYEDASCTGTIDVIARDVMLELSASARPWADALFYRSVMDGRAFEPQGGAQVDPYPGTAMAGRARELLYARCNAEEPLGPSIAPGTRRLEILAHVPGEDLRLTTTEATVSLSCPASDAGSDAAVDEGDGGARDGGALPDEPGGDGDGDVDGDGDGASRSDGGCSCRTTGGSGSSSAWVIALALLFVARRRT